MGKQGYRKGDKLHPFGLYGSGYDDRVIARYNNDRTYFHFIDYLYLAAVSRFKWEGLPDTVSQRMLEQSLIMHGSCLFFKLDVDGQFYATPSANAGNFDIYGIPLTRRVSRPNGFHKTFHAEDKDNVLIYNDYTLMPFIPVIWYYARKFTRLEIAKDVNTELQKKPKAIRTTKDNQKSIKEAIQSTQMGVPYLFVDDELTQPNDKTDVLSLDTPVILEELEKEKNALFSEYLTRLGFNNINIYKSAHLTVDESNANNEHILSFRNSALEMREEACDKINKLFGLNVSVEFNANNLLMNDFHGQINADVLGLSKDGDGDGIRNEE